MTQFKYHKDFRYWEICILARAAKTDAERAALWAHWTEPDPYQHGPVQCGYYKRRMRERWVPVWIARNDEDQLIIRYGTGAVRPLIDEWVFTRCEPISYEDYFHAFQHGRFPGEVAEGLPPVDHNAADPGGEFRDELTELLGRIETFIKGLPIPLDEPSANALANYLDVVRLAVRTAESMCKSEIADAKAKIKERTDLWSITTDAASRLANRIRGLITPYLKMRKADGQEAKLGGQAGRRIGLRPQWKARVTDWDQVYPQFRDHPKVVELIQELLDAKARSKDRWLNTVEGAEFYQEEVAA